MRSLVDGCFTSMLRFSNQQTQRAQQAQQAQRAQQQQGSGEAAEGPEVASTPAGAAGAAGAAGGAQPLDLEAMRALLLQHVPMALADLRRQHSAAEEPAERRQLSMRFVLELMLRLSICAYGALGQGCGDLAPGSSAVQALRLLGAAEFQH